MFTIRPLIYLYLKSAHSLHYSVAPIGSVSLFSRVGTQVDIFCGPAAVLACASCAWSASEPRSFVTLLVPFWCPLLQRRVVHNI